MQDASAVYRFAEELSVAALARGRLSYRFVGQVVDVDYG